MELSLLGTVLAILCVAEYSKGVTFPSATKTKYETYLKEFENQRSHIPFSPPLDANREKVTLFMKSKFTAAGLQVHEQNFTSTDTNTGKAASGTNLIAVLPGAYYKQSKDEVIILAAHIDTFGRDAGGVNNDGSGLVGLLAIAEDLTGSENCTRNRSVIFAAFDRSETENLGAGITYCNKSCGSVEFIKDINTFIGNGKVKLAIVMDCLANFDTQLKSQFWPPVLGKYFNSIVTEHTLLDANGDFLAISGRRNEKNYVEEFSEIFNAAKVEATFEAKTFQWDIQGVPTPENRTNLIAAFKDGDQISFWDNNFNTIFLTDTCYNRGYMGNCKLKSGCDAVQNIPSKGLSFMYSTLYSVMKLTKKYICKEINECQTKGCSKDGFCEKQNNGTYKCMCKHGFKGDGFKCSVISHARVAQPIPLIFILTFLLTLSYYILM